MNKKKKNKKKNTHTLHHDTNSKPCSWWMQLACIRVVLSDPLHLFFSIYHDAVYTCIWVYDVFTFYFITKWAVDVPALLTYDLFTGKEPHHNPHRICILM